MAFNWDHVDTLISSGIIGLALAGWKVFYPMWLRTVDLRCLITKCEWNKVDRRYRHAKGGMVNIAHGNVCLDLVIHLEIHLCRGIKTQISDILCDGEPFEINRPLGDGLESEYPLILTEGELTKRYLELEIERSPQDLKDDGSLAGKLIICRTGGKKKTIKYVARPGKGEAGLIEREQPGVTLVDLGEQ